MATVRGNALAALALVLEGLPGYRLVRNPGQIEDVGEGLIVLRDGNPGDPEVVLSPLTYSYQHQVPVEVYREGGLDKEGVLEEALPQFSGALEADRTLGGAVDYLTLSAPQTDFERPAGAEDLAGFRFFVTLEYDTQSPLG